jgi:hypothetical protein
MTPVPVVVALVSRSAAAFAPSRNSFFPEPRELWLSLVGVYSLLRLAIWQSSGSLCSAARAATRTPAQASARP